MRADAEREWHRLAGAADLGGAIDVIVWAFLAIAGVVLAFVASVSSLEVPAGGGGPVRVIASIPGPVGLVILSLFALAACGVLWRFLPRGLRRRRKKGEEPWVMVREEPKASPWLLAVLVVVGLSPGALAAYLLLHYGWPPFSHIPTVTQAPGFHSPTTASSLGPLPSAATLPWFSGALTLVGLLVGAASLALVLWFLYAGRIEADAEPAPAVASHSPEPLLEAVEESLDVLRQDPDHRRAVIRCYRRFERTLDNMGVPREPSETPLEFVRRTLSQFPLPSELVHRLVELFQLARFSEHPVGPRQRDQALESLLSIQSLLAGRSVHAA